jgi:hypothetical protein
MNGWNFLLTTVKEDINLDFVTPQFYHKREFSHYVFCSLNIGHKTEHDCRICQSLGVNCLGERLSLDYTSWTGLGKGNLRPALSTFSLMHTSSELGGMIGH